MTPCPTAAPLRARLAVLLLALAALATLLPAAPAEARLGGAIQPGVELVTDGSQCTANFVFTDRTGARFIGMSAHCAKEGNSTSTNGCIQRSLPLGTPVEIQNATKPGKLAYSSWATMRRVGERDENACFYNDFALVRIDPADHRRVNPTVPVFGGPTGVAPGPGPNRLVYSYGNSGLRPGDSLDAKRGRSLGQTGNGWATVVYTLTPGIPGDSGSGYLDAHGRAFGVLSSVTIAPLTGSNTVTNLDMALDYLQRHTAIRVHAPNGWRPFAP